MIQTTKSIKTGWLCPMCETIYAPWVHKCECQKTATTTTTGGAIYYPCKADSVEWASSAEYIISAEKVY